MMITLHAKRLRKLADELDATARANRLYVSDDTALAMLGLSSDIRNEIRWAGENVEKAKRRRVSKKVPDEDSTVGDLL
jgi:hypothetical protein